MFDSSLHPFFHILTTKSEMIIKS